MGRAENMDYRELEARAERVADELGRRNERLGQELEHLRRSWERKRADPAVPGANPRNPEEDSDGRGSLAPEPPSEEGSPAAEAPPEDESPFAAETPPETAVGPPAGT
jgi:hypothetical protein